MPYKLVPIGNGKYKVVSPNRVHAKSVSKETGESQIRLLQGVEHGWKPTKRLKYK